MITTKQDFTRIKGDSYPIKISLKNKTDPLDITGATITLKIQRGSTIDSISATITDAANGVAEFSFTTSTFADAGNYKYEIELLTSGGVLYTVANGTFKIQQDLG